MRCLILTIIVTLGAHAEAHGETPDDAPKTHPRLETIPIKPKHNAPCEEENCQQKPAYRLSDQQMERLRALDRQAPGEIIQLAPVPGQERTTPPRKRF